MKRLLILSTFSIVATLCFSIHADEVKLTGTPIGTERGFNYESNSVVMNIQQNAFDGDFNTYFATDQRSYTWVGLDLGTPHIITKAGWSPRNDGVGPARVRCGIIQGANSPDFLDALPLYIIQENGIIGQMSYGDINCSKGFRYVRFVSTGDSRCNIAELEFYGYPDEGDDSNLVQITNLPTVVINTFNAEEPYDKEHDIVSNIIIINDNQIDTDKPATVRERGNASRQFPKKPWRIKFDKKQSVLGAPAKCKKWTLINNYGDKTLMRNILAFEIARRMDMKFVPFCQPVDVILNGEYKGCYQLCDQVEVNGGRVEVTEMETTDISGDELTGGYLIEVDGYADQEAPNEWFRSNRGVPVTIKSPDDGGTTEQYNYIKNYFQQYENLLFSNNNTAFDTETGYRSILDSDSFLRYFIVGELTGNPDTFWSTYIYKERNDPKLYTGPVWDFDIAFDNDYRAYPTSGATRYFFDSGKASSAGDFVNHVKRIVEQDPKSTDEISILWSTARNMRDLTNENILDFIDSQAKYLDQSQKLNFKRWNILSQQVHMNPRAAGSYAGEIKWLKEFMTARFAKLDQVFKYNPAVGVETIASDSDSTTDIRIANGIIALDGETPFDVYSIDGIMLHSGVAPTRPLPRGIYVVRTPGKQLLIKI